MATMDTTEPVNLAKSILICNIFNFFFAASKICLIPFLTLYLRLLGLSASQTGIVIGGKTLSAFLFAPFWASCAMKCNTRRLVLMFSIFMMAATYLSLTLIPGINHSNNSCRSQTLGNLSQFQSTTAQSLPQLHETTIASTTVLPKIGLNESEEIFTNISEGGAGALNRGELLQTSSTTKMTTEAAKVISEDDEIVKSAKEVLKKIGLNENEINSMDKKQIIDALEPIMQAPDNRHILEKVVTEEQWLNLQKLFGGRFAKKISVDMGSQNDIKRNKRESVPSLLKIILDRMAKGKQKLKEFVEPNVFMFVMIILIIGEAFGSPVEKIADDSWFEFLEKIDDLEKYGKHRIWCSVASIIFPIIVTLIVDSTDCLFGINLHPFMLHFYLFGALLGITFLIGFYFPIPDTEKSKYKSKLIKGFGMTCCRCGGLLYMFTLLIMGVIYATYNNYLFWIIQDLHGPESTMGMCLTIASFSEIPMLYFGKLLVEKIGNGGVISISLLCLSARTLYYSYLWTPWAVLPAELAHAFTHTAMWFAVLSNPTFSINPVVDRSIRSILSSVYFGIGFATGSFTSGFIYDFYGAPILYRACAIIAVAWSPFFFLLQRCCYKPAETEIKYSRLLEADDFQSDDEDDWLEHALKDR